MKEWHVDRNVDKSSYQGGGYASVRSDITTYEYKNDNEIHIVKKVFGKKPYSLEVSEKVSRKFDGQNRIVSETRISTEKNILEKQVNYTTSYKLIYSFVY